jgi:conjugal transfer pilus assembly protein TraV
MTHLKHRIDFKRFQYSVRPILVFTAVLILTGCGAGPKESFACKPGVGVGCVSVTEVNNMVDQHRLPAQQKPTRKIKPPTTLEAETSPVSTALHIAHVSERYLRVWVAPFQDGQGNFHEAGFIHTRLVPGYWQWTGP